MSDEQVENQAGVEAGQVADAAPAAQPRGLKKRVVLQLSDDTEVIALGADGEGIKVAGWLFGASFPQGEWSRDAVLGAADKSGVSSVAFAGARMDVVTEFQRACQSVVEEGDAGAQQLSVRLPDGSEVPLNTHVTIEVKPVQVRRTGSAYQLNRRVKVFVVEIERTLVGGTATKEAILRALGAKGDLNHEVTQNIGVWTLESEDSGEFKPDGSPIQRRVMRAHLLPAYKDDPLGADVFFEEMTAIVQERFAAMGGVFNEKDVRNAWSRERSIMLGCFPFIAGGNRGAGSGFYYVPAKYKPNLDAWQAFLNELYGERVAIALPMTTVRESQEVLQDRAQEYVHAELERVVGEVIENFEHNLTYGKKVKDSTKREDYAVAQAQRVLERRLKELELDKEEVNRALLKQFKVERARLDPEAQARLKGAVSDPRLKSVFYDVGVFEAESEDEAENVKREAVKREQLVSAMREASKPKRNSKAEEPEPVVQEEGVPTEANTDEGEAIVSAPRQPRADPHGVEEY